MRGHHRLMIVIATALTSRPSHTHLSLTCPVVYVSLSACAVMQNDLWISLDGGLTWGSCSGTNATNSNTEPWPARKDAGAFLDSNGYLYISGGLGQFYSTQFSTGIQYQAYNDLYKSTISFNNISLIAQQCNLQVPQCGVGLAWSAAAYT